MKLSAIIRAAGCFAFLVILLAIVPRGAHSAAWSAQYAGQSAAPTLGSGDTATLTIDFQNAGTQAWSNTGANPVRLGTSHPRDRTSIFSMKTWLGSARPATFSGRVTGGVVTPTATINPGETARFSFAITAPPVNAPTTFNEYFQPVVEGVQWLEDYGVYFPITVTPKTFAYTYAGQTNPPSLMQPGQRVSLTLDLQNSGTATWHRDAFTSFHVGTSHPLDRASPFRNETWLGQSRLSNFSGKLVAGSVVDSDTVAPGETARFAFDFVAPNTSGNYAEYFQPLIENVRWLNDVGMYFPTSVSSSGYNFAYAGQDNPAPVEHGGQATLKLRLLNTGGATWSSSGPTPVRLGTDHPRDRGSGFYTADGGWLSHSRIHLTRNLTDPAKDVAGETTVAPGEVGEWEFVITAPSVGGRYPEYFTPVVDGVTWMKDIGIFFPIDVKQTISVGIANQGATQTEPIITSNATTTVRDDMFVYASPTAGTTVRLGYNGVSYTAMVGSTPFTSSNPIRVEQPPGAIATVSGLADNASFNQFRGNLLLRNGAVGLWLVNLLNLEDYLKGGGEVPDNWPLEAIKAQTVAARTFAARRMNFPQNSQFQIYDDTRDQVYNGYLAEAAKPNTTTAVNQTTGVVIYYGGQLIQAFYSSDSGGATEANENVFGSSPIPYLRGVGDPYQKPDVWTKTVSNATLQANFGHSGNIDRIDVTAFYPSGRAKTVVLTTTGGSVTTHTQTTEGNRNDFTTRSDLITGLSRSGNDWVIGGRGFGHGLGMGQWGAFNQANAGRSAGQILSFYYTGITLGSL